MIPPMKIWKLPSNKEGKLQDLCEGGNYFAQEKVDGYWYQYEKTALGDSFLFSRNVSKVTGIYSEKSNNVPHIINALSSLPNETILIGEIYYPGGTSKSVTPIMGALSDTAIKRQEKNPIHFYIHDIIYYKGIKLINTPAWDRYRILRAVWEKHKLQQFDFLRIADAITENIEQYIDKILRQGLEGVVLKKKKALYSPDKRPAWDTIKIKKMDSIDAICLSLIDATKEYTGKLKLGYNFNGKEASLWPYWCIFKKDNISEGNNLNHDLYNDFPILVEKIPIGNKPEMNEKKSLIALPVTKPYYYNWKTAMEIGAYDKNMHLKSIGTVSSGFTEKDKQDMTDHPEMYIGEVFSIKCMEKNNKDQTLRHPAILNKRFDKKTSDCLLEEIFLT